MDPVGSAMGHPMGNIDDMGHPIVAYELGGPMASHGSMLPMGYAV